MGRTFGGLIGRASAFVGAVLATTGVAAAQRGFGSEISNPDVTTDELARYAQMLDLSDDQSEQALLLFEGYLAEFETLSSEWEKLREGAVEEFRQSRDRSVWRDLQPIMAKTMERKTELADGFFDDYRLLLTADQDAQWPRVERTRRRERTLQGTVGGFTVYSGERVDLVKVVGDTDGITGAGREAVASLLEQYELDLDRALVDRNEVVGENFQRGMEMMRNGQFDEMQELIDESAKASAKVRDVNERYVKLIAASLPDAERTVFADEVNREMFPRVYRDTYLHRAIETAEAFDDLTPEQGEQVSSIKARYARQAERLNERWVEAIRDGEKEITVRSLRRGGRSEAEREVAGERRELSESMLEDLRAVLTDEQKALLPEPPARDQFRDFRGRRGEGGPGGRRGQDRRGRQGADA